MLTALLAANLLAGSLKLRSLVPWYAGLFAAIAASWLVPAAGLLSFPPLFFAGVVFSVSFARSKEPAADFGANIAGAIVGGLAENASMMIGFRGLALLAAGLYAAAAFSGLKKN